MKFIKWSIAVVVSLFILLIAYLTLIFDLNDFKPQIIDAVKQQTGRDFSIEQDLSWTFFPSIGIALGDIKLANPKGFKHPEMLSVKGVVAEVALMPLLSKEVEVSQLNLDGLTLNLDSYSDGRSSFDGLTSSEPTKVQTQTDTASSVDGSVQLSSLNVGGVAITNTQINLFDEATGQTQTFTLEELLLGEFSLDKLATFSYKFSANLPDLTVLSEGEGKIKVASSLKQISINDFIINNQLNGQAIPNQQLTNSLKLTVEVNTETQQLVTKIDDLAVEDIKASGEVKVSYGNKIPAIVASMNFGDINLDKWIPKSAETADKPATEKTKSPEQEPDLSALKTIDLNLALTAKSINVDKIKTTNWDMVLTIKNGILDLNKLSANLYQGQLMTKAKLDGRQKVASYSFNTDISGIQVRPLLIDVAEVDLLAGKTKFSVSGSGKSLITDNIKRNLLAKGQFEVADGALYGVNIPQMIRDAQAKLSGDLNAASSGEKKTDFTSLTGSFTMAKGEVNNPDLAMASPLLRLGGKGGVNIITEAIDYKLTTTLVGSLEGQGGSGKDALKGVDIPFAITGSMSEPKFALDTAALFDAKLKQETDKAKDKLKDKLFKNLGGF
ncbi:AsmA family protein [Shewanella sp. Isolate11]|uniref:AsmA family protein n=1 Tax=Shewanella sp. Isolate11 TaxID=2908530 RepID=UPI001EFD43C3|nr:AsmA family protein [Shewanella sp. Isolate11]MCG9696542.1 AsmA family protein [Shewanella sp. Isolate11]